MVKTRSGQSVVCLLLQSEKVNSDVFSVRLEFADSLFLVPCYSNTVTVMLGTPNVFVVPTQKNGSAHPGKPFAEKVVVIIHIYKA